MCRGEVLGGYGTAIKSRHGARAAGCRLGITRKRGREGKEKAELEEMELNSHTNGPSRNQPALAQRMACFLGFVWPLALARLEESETYSRRRNRTGRRQEDGSKTREGLDGTPGWARAVCFVDVTSLGCYMRCMRLSQGTPLPPFPSVQGAQEQESGAAQSRTCASSIVERSVVDIQGSRAAGHQGSRAAGQQGSRAAGTDADDELRLPSGGRARDESPMPLSSPYNLLACSEYCTIIEVTLGLVSV